MRRHRAALIDIQCNCPGGTDGGGIIRPSPWLLTPAATPQLGEKMPPLQVLLSTASIKHDSGAKGTTREEERSGGGGATNTASPTPSVYARAIDAATATPPWQGGGVKIDKKIPQLSPRRQT